MDAEIIDTLEVCFDDLDELQVELGMTDRLPEQTKSVTLTKNGNYSVMPDKDKVLTQVDVVANVLPTAETLYATENGTYTPQNADCFDKVEINVPTILQDKTVTITENGVTEVTADEGYDGLGKVSISTKVIQKIQPESIYWRGNGTVTYVPGELIDTSNMSSFGSMFQSCSALQTVDTSEWITNKVTDVGYMFWQNHKLKALDFSSWNMGACTNINNFMINCYVLNTLIGNHTLEEVESGDVVALLDAGKSTATVSLSFQSYPRVKYASLLAVMNGLYDRSETTAGTITISNSAFTPCYNDDGTQPDAATVTSRQTRIREIAAAKNYTLSLS